MKEEHLGKYEIPIILKDEKLLEVEYILDLEVLNSFSNFGIIIEEEIEEEPEVIEVIEEVVVNNNPKVTA